MEQLSAHKFKKTFLLPRGSVNMRPFIKRSLHALKRALVKVKPYVTVNRISWLLVFISIVWNIWKSYHSQDVDELQFYAIFGWVMAGMWLSMVVLQDWSYGQQKKILKKLLEDNQYLYLDLIQAQAFIQGAKYEQKKNRLKGGEAGTGH